MPLPVFPISGGLLDGAPLPLGSVPGENRGPGIHSRTRPSIHPKKDVKRHPLGQSLSWVLGIWPTGSDAGMSFISPVMSEKEVSITTAQPVGRQTQAQVQMLSPALPSSLTPDKPFLISEPQSPSL